VGSLPPVSIIKKPVSVLHVDEYRLFVGDLGDMEQQP